MTNDALINSKIIMLSEDEKQEAEKFHKSRYAFAWVNGKLVFNDKRDDRDHQHWLLEDFSVTIEEFENLNRGYMLPTYIQLFRGSKFSPIDTSEISVLDFKELCKIHGNKYGTDKVEVRNGVKIGKIGEVWPPISIIGTFDTI